MANASDWLETAVLNYFFRKQTVVQPQACYLALYKNNPTDADTGTEVSGGAYQRVGITFAAPTQEQGKGQIKNNVQVVFPIASADWGEITHWGVRDALTAGNLICWGEFDKTENIEVGNRLIIDINKLIITIE